MKLVNGYIIIILFIICPTQYCVGQIITTITGGGAMSPGDGFPATSIYLANSPKVAVDKCGNIYIGESFAHRVRKVDALTGTISTIAGTGIGGFNSDGILATAAQLNQPTFLCFDSVGNLYIGDGLNNRIRKVNRNSGIITTVAGNGVAGCTGDGGLATAAAIAAGCMTWDNQGNIFLGDLYKIRKIDAYGIITTIAGTGTGGGPLIDDVPAISANVTNSLGISTDKYGNVYFIDSAGSVRKITVSTGLIKRVAGTGISVGLYTGDGVPATACYMNPFDIHVDDTGNIYLACNSNHRVIKVDTFGITHTVAGTGVMGFSGDGGSALSAQFRFPRGLDMDRFGNLYIADFNNNRIRKVTYNPATFPTPVLSVSISPNDTVCAGTPATFSAVLTGSGYPVYRWYKNGTLVPAATGSTYTYTPAHGDSVRCEVAGLCNGATVWSNTTYMTIGGVEPGVSVTGPAMAPLGSTVTMNATVTGIATGYSLRWMNRGIPIAVTTTPVVTYTKVWEVDTITVRVLPPPTLGCYDSTTSAPHYVHEGTVGVPYLQTAGVMVYPNPAGSYVTISSAMPITSVCITNVLGQVVTAPPGLPQGEVTVPVGHLPKGVYVVRINGLYVQRLVKE